MAPLYKTQSPIRYWSPILTSGEQIKRLIFEVLIMEAVGSWWRENNGKNLEACMWVLWTWIGGWVCWWFWLGLWFGFRLCLISICDLGLCLCLVSVSFFFFFFVLLWSRFEFLVAGFVFSVAGFDLGRTRRTLGLCLCLVSVSFLFFRLCCCDLGLSFWLLDLCSWLLGLIWV